MGTEVRQQPARKTISGALHCHREVNEPSSTLVGSGIPILACSDVVVRPWRRSMRTDSSSGVEVLLRLFSGEFLGRNGWFFMTTVVEDL